MLGSDNAIGPLLPVKRGEDWKRIRTVMSPAFSTGKMHLLVPILAESAHNICKVIDRYVDNGKEIPLQE